ncbi:MAG: LemA family protein [Xenococcaceae cyanobacterium]
MIFLTIGIYNTIIVRKNQVDRAFSSIDVLLKKRCDLIPNLIAVVKKYMDYEQKTLTEVVRLRSRVVSGDASSEQRFILENQLSRTIGNIVALIENYPELKANIQCNQLIETLNEVEEQISAARRFYNTAVTEYNNAIEVFPNNLVASFMNVRAKRVFEATEEDRRNVNVSQLLGN